MRALEYNPGPGAWMEFTGSRPVPVPGEHEILVQVAAVGMNHSDYQTVEWMRSCQITERIVLGIDVAGIVAQVGAAVRNFKPGDRVYYLGRAALPHGGYAEYACTAADTASHLPDAVPFEVAAALPATGYTAYHILYHKFRARAGKSILIQGGAGGVGSFAIQMAKRCGLQVLTTCLPKDAAYVKTLGADQWIDFTSENVPSRVKELTHGRGVDYYIDIMGKKTATESLEYLAFGGEMACAVDFPDLSAYPFFQKGISIHEIALGAANGSQDPCTRKILADTGEALADLVAAGEIVPPEITLISLGEVGEYLKKLKAREITGKVVTKI